MTDKGAIKDMITVVECMEIEVKRIEDYFDRSAVDIQGFKYDLEVFKKKLQQMLEDK